MRVASSSVIVMALAGVAIADPEMTAEKEFSRGREMMKAKRYAEACAAFQQSQQLDPQFGTLYNLATCDAQIGKLASAWNAFRQLAISDPNADRRARAAQLAKDLDTRVPRVVIAIADRDRYPSLVVRLDGNDVTNLVGVAAPAASSSATTIRPRIAGMIP